ncbi:hypothetical protein ACO0LL_28245 [Undibacterium sp. TC4M20W]|uniref:hypothetical protein n=1 Tax=Undibacterium sp. TC4M20W TaxID=3413052 RepID=UPI003BF124F0
MKIPGLKLMLMLMFAFSAASASASDADIDQFYCHSRAADSQCERYAVSIINLITAPERFHGKKISVTGYLLIADETIALQLSKDSSPAESVWLSIQEGQMETENDFMRYQKKEKQLKSAFNRKRVLIEGIFDMHTRAHLYRGSVKDITRIDYR